MSMDNNVQSKLEELLMNTWPSIQTKLYDGWVLRYADGYTKRANSVNPIYNSTIDLDEKIDFCEKQYALQNLPTIYKLNKESNPKGIDQRLEERGYYKEDETSVRILEMDCYKYYEPMDMVAEPQFSNQWLEGYFKCAKLQSRKDQTIVTQMLGNVFNEVICVSKKINGEVVGCGYGAIERGSVGIYNIIIEDKHRGKGYGEDVMNGILSAAYKKGVDTAYLSVVVGNTPAEKLYEKLGFTEIYQYWYRIGKIKWD